MRILILGVTGMAGNALFDAFSTDSNHEVWGTLRADEGRRHFGESAQERLISGVDVTDEAAVPAVLARAKPDVVINGIGIVKQLAAASDPLITLPVNAMFPHRLAALCAERGARVIQLSTDCIFSGRKGNYEESDPSDADDLYGKSKHIGELHDFPNAITIRKSGIGHELGSAHGLLEWFLAQRGTVRGFSKAIYSGFTWVELARLIRDVIVPRTDLRGLYHVSAEPITKLELLRLIARVYGKEITIQPDDSLALDRSLDSRRFTAETGYVAPDWPAMIGEMYRHHNRASRTAPNV